MATSINFPPSYYAPEYLQIHRRALRNSIYGAGNIIKTEISSGRITYVMNSTGERFETMNQAFDAADKSGLTGFARLAGGGPEESGSMRGLHGFNERVRSIQEMLQNDSKLRDSLSFINSPTDRLTFTTGSLTVPESAKETAKNVLKSVSKGKGFMFQTKDSGTFVKAFINDVELTSVELNELLFRTSDGAGGLFSNEQILTALEKGDLGALFMKSAKRGKGIFSLDGISLAGNDLLTLAKNLDSRSSAFSTFGDSVKIFDTEKDLTKIASQYLRDVSNNVSVFDEENLVRRAMAGLSPDEINQAVDFYAKSGAIETTLSAMEELRIISRNDAGLAKVLIDNPELVDALKTGSAPPDGSEAAKRYKELMESFKRPFDGSTLINEDFVKGMRKNMQAELSALEAKGVMNLSPEEFETRNLLKSDLANSQLGMDADTIRIYFMRYNKDLNINETLNLKGIGVSAKLKQYLKQFSLVTTETNVKRELAIMGKTDMVNIILQGEGRNLVFQDPLAPAFHGEIFSSPEAVEATAARGRRILDAYTEALSTGQFDQTLKSEIYKQSEQIIEAVPIEFRQTARRSKDFAKQLVRALESGVDIRQQPQLANYLMKFVQSQIAREKGNTLQPVMEDVFRFAVTTEPAYYAGRELGEDSASLKNTTAYRLSSDGDPIGLMNFKIRGHNLLMAGHAANIFHHSLGTFDLDDKGIPVMRAMEVFGDKGESLGDRIGFFTFRQPTGPAEYVLSVADFDTETIRRTFGQNKSYVSALNDIVEKGTATRVQQIIYEMISPERMSQPDMFAMNKRFLSGTNIQTELHQAMLSVMQASGSPMPRITRDIIDELKFEKYGSPLALDENRYNILLKAGVNEKQLTANYRQGNIYKLFAEEGTYKLEDSVIQELLDNPLLQDPKYSAEMKKIKSLVETGAGHEEIKREMAKILRKGGEEEQLLISNLLVKELGAKQLLAIETADSLGGYINRLTMVTASTRQSENILERLGQSPLASAADDIARLREGYKVGLIDPGQAIDYAINMSSGQKVNKLVSESHYTEEIYNSLMSSIRSAADSQADMRGVVQSLARLTGRQDLLGDASKVLNLVGTQAIEEQGKYIGALRAIAYKHGIEDPDYLAGVDELILKQRLRGSDNAIFRDAIISGFKDFSSEIDASNELAKAFITSLESAGSNNTEINNILIKTIGITSGRYAGVAQMARDAYRATAGVMERGRVHGVNASLPFMGEASITTRGRKAASQVLNLQQAETERLIALSAGIEYGVRDPSELLSAQLYIEKEMLGAKLYESIRESAKATNSTLREVIDSIDYMSGSRSGLMDLTSYSSGGDEANELMNIVQGVRDGRAISHYKKQDGLMDLVDQYDAFKKSTDMSDLNLYNAGVMDSRMNGLDPIFDPVMEAMNMEISDTKELKNVPEDVANQVRSIRAASAAKESQTPELLDLLAKRGNAIGFAPTMLSDEDRLVMLGDEAIDVSGSLVGRTYRRIGDSFRDGAMNKAFQNPTVKKAGYAGLAIIAASFAFQHGKGRSPEDVGGPPLLPGGSAYEQMPQRSPQIPQASMYPGYGQGTSYSVNIEGSSDQINSFRSAAGSVAPGSVNSTMYKGLPKLGTDPYSQVASSF